MKKFASKQPGQHSDRKEEIVIGAYPTLRIDSETTASDHAMDMGMKVKFSSPSMKYCSNTEYTTEMLFIFSQLE